MINPMARALPCRKRILSRLLSISWARTRLALSGLPAGRVVASLQQLAVSLMFGGQPIVRRRPVSYCRPRAILQNCPRDALESNFARNRTFSAVGVVPGGPE